MPRSLWSGSLSFGLVNLPVNLVTRVRDLDLHFRQLHRKDGAPIEVQRWCSEEQVEIPWEEITHGYELDDGRQIVVSDLELQAIEPRRTRTIEIEQFIDLADADPIYFDHPYLLAPASDDDGTRRAYRLLSEVMSQTERAALGRFVMRTKEYLAIVRARDQALTLTTMRFADEVRSPRKLDAATQKSHKPSRRELEVAVAVIEELSADWDPDRYEDRYRRRLKRIVDRKRKGETIQAPKPAAGEREAPDLMEALERTLAELSGRTSDKPAKRSSAKPKRSSAKPAKRSSAKPKRSSAKTAKPRGAGRT